MSLSTLPIAELIHKVDAWSLTRKGFTAHLRSSGVTEFKVVSEQELSQLHECAPLLLRRLIKNPQIVTENPFGSLLHGRYFEASLRIQYEGHALVDHRGEHFHMLDVIALQQDSYTGNVCITGAAYPVTTEVVQLKSGTRSFRYPNAMVQSLVIVSAEKMDTDYPGWRERLTVVELVVDSTEEVATHVLTNSPTIAEVDLTGLQID